MTKTTNIIKFGIAIISIIGICLGVLATSYLYSKRIPVRDSWKKYTTPLPSEISQDICRKFEISDQTLCDEGKVVYAPDFFSLITESFHKGETTYQDVQEKIESYQISLEPVKKRMDGTSYFVSVYDLRGDGVTSITFFFSGNYGNNILERIGVNYGDPSIN